MELNKNLKEPKLKLAPSDFCVADMLPKTLI